MRKVGFLVILLFTAQSMNKLPEWSGDLNTSKGIDDVGDGATTGYRQP